VGDIECKNDTLVQGDAFHVSYQFQIKYWVILTWLLSLRTGNFAGGLVTGQYKFLAITRLSCLQFSYEMMNSVMQLK
jgi:hypothetical protein